LHPTTHLSTPKGRKAESAWLADLQRTVYPHKSAAGLAQDRERSAVKDQRSTAVPRNQPSHFRVNPLMATIKPQSNTMIGTLTVDRWAVTFGTARRGLGGLQPRPLLAVLNVTAQPTYPRPVYQLHVI